MNKSFKVLTAGFILINICTFSAVAQDQRLGATHSKNNIKNPTFSILKLGMMKDGIIEKRMKIAKVLPPELIVGLIKYQLKNTQGPKSLKK